MSSEEYFRKYVHALKKMSDDNCTKTAAVIVGINDTVISNGYNTFPTGVLNTEERQLRPEKYFWFIHAEMFAIIKAAKHGLSVDGCTMYMSCDIPCTDCTKAIINSGIKRIVCERDGGSKNERWNEHRIRSLKMCEESGILVEYYD
jgi:dCMP deaminase